jgi:hypothetical protein
MIYLNKNTTLDSLEEIVTHNIEQTVDYMPDTFNEQQRYALELFKQRIHLEKTIDETIAFNKKLVFTLENKNLSLTTTAEELVDVFKLRSDVYHSINYQDEFPDTIEGLNFDSFDNHAGILYYKHNGQLTGTIKVIFDTNQNLPSEEKYSFDYLRNDNTIVELSRFIIKNNDKGLNQEFKYLTQASYNLFKNNNINRVVSSIKQDHFKLYSKFGGMTVETELPGYGLIDIPFIVVSWNPDDASPFFKKAFLD